MIAEFRTSDAILNFVNGAELARYGASGRDHARPRDPHQALAADPARAGSRQARRVQAGRGAGRRGLSSTATETYFDAPQRARRRRQAHARSAAPRRAGARARAVRPRPHRPRMRGSPPTRARAAVATITDAEAIGRFEIDHAKPTMFDVRILAAGAGQARRREGAAARRPGRRRSPARAARSAPRPRRAFAQAGAEVALLDVDYDAAAEQAKAIGATPLPIACDVTDAASVRAAFDAGRRDLRRRRHRRLQCRRGAGRAGSARSTRRRCARASS